MDALTGRGNTWLGVPGDKAWLGHQGEQGMALQALKGGEELDGSRGPLPGRGGRLASVTTEEEWQQVKPLASGQFLVHMGGSDEEVEGVWSWSDGSSWRLTQWSNARGSRGDSFN